MHPRILLIYWGLFGFTIGNGLALVFREPPRGLALIFMALIVYVDHIPWSRINELLARLERRYGKPYVLRKLIRHARRAELLEAPIDDPEFVSIRASLGRAEMGRYLEDRAVRAVREARGRMAFNDLVGVVAGWAAAAATVGATPSIDRALLFSVFYVVSSLLFWRMVRTQAPHILLAFTGIHRTSAAVTDSYAVLQWISVFCLSGLLVAFHAEVTSVEVTWWIYAACLAGYVVVETFQGFHHMRRGLRRPGGARQLGPPTAAGIK